MNQLVPADVANLRCRFAYELHQFLKCEKYSISCCIDAALESFLNYKLAAHECTLDDDILCTLQNYKKPTKLLDCASDIPCEAQATLVVKNLGGGAVYTPTIINELFDTDAPLYTATADAALTPNSIYHDATVNVGIIDEDLQIIDQTTFTTGTAKVGMSVVSSPTYSIKIRTVFKLDNVTNLSNGYIKTVRLYYTNNIGQLNPNQYWDVDVSPITSPYRLCGTCNPVAAPDLYLSSANWGTAMKVILDNAVRVLTGAVNMEAAPNIGIATNKQLVFITTNKHLPTGIWAGLNHKDFRFTYYNGTNDVIVTQSSSGPVLQPTSGNMYGTHDFVENCGTKTVEIANTSLTVAVNSGASTFNNLVLSSNKTLWPVSIVNTTPLDCSFNNIQLTVVSNKTITQVEWLNSSDVVVETGYFFTTTDTGDFSVRVTLDTGCVLTEEFTIE